MPSATPKSYRVLLFEDSLEDELLAVRALRSSGLPLDLRVARDGEEALAALGLIASGNGEWEMELPHLVISDLNMPKVKGDEVLERARCDSRFREVPFIVFSSSGEPEEVRRCLNLGASAYYVKPMVTREYTDCIREIIERWLPLGDPQSIEQTACLTQKF